MYYREYSRKVDTRGEAFLSKCSHHPCWQQKGSPKRWSHKKGTCQNETGRVFLLLLKSNSSHKNYSFVRYSRLGLLTFFCKKHKKSKLLYFFHTTIQIHIAKLQWICEFKVWPVSQLIIYLDYNTQVTYDTFISHFHCKLEYSA